MKAGSEGLCEAVGLTVHQAEDLLVSVLIQLIVIVLAARVAGSVAQRIGQPRAVGEIAAGLMLGPSLFGYFLPEISAQLFTQEAGVPMQVLSQIGLILLMFQIGSDFEFGHLSAAKNRRAVMSVSLASIAVPLVTGFAAGWFSHGFLAPGIDRLIYSLFTAIAFAITAVPILGRILREYGLTRHEIGVVAISAAAANDVMGWVLLAAVAALASAGLSMAGLALQLGGLALFGAGLWFIGRPLVARLLERMPVREGAVPVSVMPVVLAAIFASGIATQKLGIFTIFGGFAFGLLFHRYTDFVEAWRRQVGQFVLVFFLPIFFTYTGLRTNVLGLVTAQDWMWCAAIFAGAVLSKIIPVYFAARASGFDGAQARIMGVLMNTRALMELIVLNVGYSLGFLPQNVFTMLVLMAIGTTVMTGPLLRMLMPKAGLKVLRLAES
jgi:Kef-type K+ transport system membrane component KefB